MNWKWIFSSNKLLIIGANPVCVAKFAVSIRNNNKESHGSSTVIFNLGAWDAKLMI